MSKKILLVLMSLVLLVPAASNAALHTKTWMTNDAQDLVTVHVRCWNKTGGPAPDSLTVYKRYGYYSVGNRWSNLFGWDSVPGAVGAQARDPDSTSGITISYLAGHYDVLQKPVQAKVRVNNGAYSIMEAENHTVLNNPTPTITYSSASWSPGVTADGRLIVNAQVITNVSSRIQLRLFYGGVLKYTVISSAETNHNLAIETGMASRGDVVTVDFRAYDATVSSYSSGTFGAQTTTLATQTPVIASSSLVSLCNAFAGGTMTTSSAFSTPINFRWRRLGTSTWLGSSTDGNINTAHTSFLSHYETCAAAAGYLYEFQMQLVFHDATTSVWFPVGSFPWYALAPVSQFTYSAVTGVAPLTVNFTDTSTNGPTSWAWQFGNGAQATTQNASYTYVNAGTYTVTLTTTNSAGSDAEVKTGLVIVTPNSSSDPIVSGVSGTLSHGGDITVTGSNFGVRNPVVDVFDDIEGGFDPTWTAIQGTATSTARLRHARSATSKYFNFSSNGATNQSGFTVEVSNGGPNWYGSFWFYPESNFNWGTNNTTEYYLANTKMFRLWHQTSSCSDGLAENMSVIQHGWLGGNGAVGIDYSYVNGTDAPCYYNYGADWRTVCANPSQWHQIEFEANTSDDNNGIIKVWVDGNLIKEASNPARLHCDVNQMYLHNLGFFETGYGNDGDFLNEMYMDDFYAASTLARIFVGDSPSFNDCNVRELQLPITWSDGTITTKLNRGGLPTGTAYMFVVNSAGVASAGTAFTIAP